jgi:pilus assembly protein CpaC
MPCRALLAIGIGFLCLRAQESELVLTVGKSLSIDSPQAIRRVAAANDTVVECVAIAAKELLVNAKAPGETSVVIWLDDNTRQRYNVTVRPSPARIDAVRAEIARETGNVAVDIALQNETVFVRGNVKDAVTAERVMTIASTLGKAVNLLYVSVPPTEPQVLLMVRFASVDRSAGRDLGINLAGGAFQQTTAIGTGPPASQDGGKTFSLSQAVNILLVRKDINLLAAIQALETRRQLDILAEPNVLALNGTPANFVAGGEFPYPMVQPGLNGNTVTIAFKEYGVRLGFLPQVTPRGTIRLQVAPEVSALDYNNAVTVAGTTIPGTSTRRVQTEVELESGQSFVIAGLLDRQTTESLSRIPGIAYIPVLGKLFQSKTVNRANSELLILITPEIVRPIPAGQPLPEVEGRESTRQPGLPKTGPVPVHPPSDQIPIETLNTPRKAPPPPAK